MPDDEVALKKKEKKDKKRAAYEAANPPKADAGEGGAEGSGSGGAGASTSAVFQDETLSDQAKKGMSLPIPLISCPPLEIFRDISMSLYAEGPRTDLQRCTMSSFTLLRITSYKNRGNGGSSIKPDKGG